MPNVEMFLSLAEIAGVFIGFGALISAARGSLSELWLIRNVVTDGLLVVAAALIVVVISDAGVGGHELWASCSLFVLVLNGGIIVLMHARREYWAYQALPTRATRAGLTLMLVLLEIPLWLALLSIVLGLRRDLEPTLYLAAVVLMLFEVSALLVMLVFSQGGPASAASSPAA